MFVAIIVGATILFITNNFGIAVSVAIAILMVSEKERNKGE